MYPSLRTAASLCVRGIFMEALGLLMVLAALGLFIICIRMMNANLRENGGKPFSISAWLADEPDTVKPAPAAPVQAPAVQAARPTPAVISPAVGAGIAAETVAAISAAIAVMTDQPCTITSISRADALPAPAAAAPVKLPYQRPVWAVAAVQHNTKPF